MRTNLPAPNEFDTPHELQLAIIGGVGTLLAVLAIVAVAVAIALNGML